MLSCINSEWARWNCTSLWPVWQSSELLVQLISLPQFLLHSQLSGIQWLSDLNLACLWILHVKNQAFVLQENSRYLMNTEDKMTSNTTDHLRILSLGLHSMIWEISTKWYLLVKCRFVVLVGWAGSLSLWRNLSFHTKEIYKNISPIAYMHVY